MIMDEDFKKWLCELVGYRFWPQNLDCNEDIELAILIKAMWAINDKWLETKSNKQPKIIMTPEGFDLFICKTIMHFSNKQCSNQDALAKVLKYIFKEKNNHI